MGSYDDRVAKPLSRVTGKFLGDALLPVLKEEMLCQRVFRGLFGEKGERIFVTDLPSVNDTVIPLFEAHWKSESWQSKNTRVAGVIDAMILLPPELLGRTDRFRPIAMVFARWLESDHQMFQRVPGLIEFGKNVAFKYDSAIRAGAATIPMVEMTIPCLFDLQRFRLANPSVDLDAALDEPELGDITTYSITITDENMNVLIPTGVLLKAQSEEQENG